MNDPTAPERERQAAAAFKRLFKPITRALIAFGVSAPTAYRLLKEALVESAEEAYALDGKRMTDSRVSLLTGVHRKEVKEIREGRAAAETRANASVLATVVGRWRADPAYLDPRGGPAALRRLTDPSAPGPDFERLVESVSKDVRPRTILDELMRQGAVTLDKASDTVRLDVEAYVSQTDDADKLHFFVHNLGDHAAAAAANLAAEAGRKPPNLERAVFYNKLSSASVDALEAMARALAGDALAELNRAAHARQQADIGAAEAAAQTAARNAPPDAPRDAPRDAPPDATSAPQERFRFGVYFYREDEGRRADASGSDKEAQAPGAADTGTGRPADED